MSARDGTQHTHGTVKRRREDAHDIRDVFKGMKAVQQDQHRAWHQQNFDAIKTAGLRYTVTNDGLCIVIREVGKPQVDFYPSTGRWRVVGKSPQTFGGHAEKFLRWYAEAKP